MITSGEKCIEYDLQRAIKEDSYSAGRTAVTPRSCPPHAEEELKRYRELSGKPEEAVPC